MPQRFVTTFCSYGEYSYNRDYISQHQQTMNCYVGHLFDVDVPTFPEFFAVIRLLVKDPSKLTPLSNGFPIPQPITQGPLPRQ